MGKHSGFITRQKNLAPHVYHIQCFIHKQHLASKKLREELEDALNLAISIVNIIEANSLNHRIFQQICHDEDKEHVVLLLHIKVR